MAKTRGTMSYEEEQRIKDINKALRDLDQIIENAVTSIRTEVIRNTGGAPIAETRATSEFKNIINTIEIDGDEDLLKEINEKYDDYIKKINEAIEKGNPKFKAQFQNELRSITTNRSQNFDPIYETYQELSDRLDRGEVQRDYFQDKADRKQTEIDDKEEFYKEKIGNADRIANTLEPEAEKIAQKEEIKRQYEKLLKLNRDIEKVENDLRAPDLEDEEKAKLEEKLEELKEDRKEAVEEFSKTATDKDGKKYEKPEGKSDKDYITEIDSNRVDEAILMAVQGFNQKMTAMDPDKRKVMNLDTDLNEMGEFDIATLPVTDYKSAEKLLNSVASLKSLWKDKMKRDGFDKAKMQREQKEFQEKADFYDEGMAEYDEYSHDDGARYPVAQEKFDWKHPIQSIRSLFQRRKNQKTVNNDFDIDETKKEVLKYLEKNKGNLAQVKASDRNSKNKTVRESFLNAIRFNVSKTTPTVKKSWDKQAQKNKGNDGR